MEKIGKNNWERLIFDKKWMRKLAEDTYSVVQQELLKGHSLDVGVNAYSVYCSYVNSRISTFLKTQGVPAEYLEHGRGTVDHGFVRIKGHKKYVVDFQYLQFQEEATTDSPHMVFSYSTRGDVEQKLKRFGIKNSRYQNYFLDELFWDE